MEVPLDEDRTEDLDNLEIAEGHILLNRPPGVVHPFVVPAELVESLGLPAYCPMVAMELDPSAQLLEEGEESPAEGRGTSTPIGEESLFSPPGSPVPSTEGCIWGQGSSQGRLWSQPPSEVHSREDVSKVTTPAAGEAVSGENINLPKDDSWEAMDEAAGGRQKRSREESWLPDTRVRKKMELEGLSLRPRYARQAKQVRTGQDIRQRGEQIFKELKK